MARALAFLAAVAALAAPVAAACRHAPEDGLDAAPTVATVQPTPVAAGDLARRLYERSGRFPARFWTGGRTIWAGFRYDGRQLAAGEVKVLWLKPLGRRLFVSGRRLDGEAPPLVARLGCCYDAGTVQPSTLVFPAPGLWQVAATAGSWHVRLVVRVAAAA